MAKKIMIQGTMSGVGKSLLTAALCRIFHQDGYRAAPFKSQNMALNSYVTADGCELGRAQAMQAGAACIEPVAEMNPVLLKPTGDMCSQVMVMGESHGLMSAREYQEYKKELVPVIRSAFDRLDSEYDIVVIEGAGGCAEINLRRDDIVNMGLARMLDAPVAIAGDIDRGGVFAQLLGSVEWLEKADRALVEGFIINRFRGDPSLLEPGPSMLLERTGIPLLGVVPYVRLDIEDEDSLSPRLENRRGALSSPAAPGEGHSVDIAVIRLPRISNFTDFDVFEAMSGVRLRYVDTARALGDPDMIIIPGSKNTIGDVRWLERSGLGEEIKKKALGNTVIFGICGGYQMLGRTIRDPWGEDEEGEACGLALLDMETVYEKEKVTRRVKGRFASPEGPLSSLSGLEFSGYEIHAGRSRHSHGSLIHIEQEKSRGKDVSVSEQDGSEGGFCNNIYGTYVHGIFDRTAPVVVEALCRMKGVENSGSGSFDMALYRQGQYDILADAVRAALDMERIYGILR